MAVDQACLIETTESSSEMHELRKSAFSPHAHTVRRLEREVSDPADRRSHRRHEVSAQVHVTDQASGMPIDTRLSSLNYGGCYLKTGSPLNVGGILGITATKGSHSFQSRARVVCHDPGEGMGVMFVDTAPDQMSVLRSWLNESLERLWLTTERRRTQRVLVQVPVRVTGHNGFDSFIEETHTRMISADGCSVTLSMQVSKAQPLMLLNLRTQGITKCEVAHVMKLPDRRYEVGMVFVLPDKKFWPVAFPQSDRSNVKDVA